MKKPQHLSKREHSPVYYFKNLCHGIAQKTFIRLSCRRDLILEKVYHTDITV